MIQRILTPDGSPTVTAIDKDVAALVDEFNKGVDPTTIPDNSLVANKLRLSTIGTGSAAYVTGFSGGVPVPIPAGGVGSLTLGVNSGTIGTGVGSGQYFLVTPYVDLFVDPTGSGPASLDNPYATNSPEGPNIFAHKCLVFPYIMNSATTFTPRMFNLVIQVANLDTASHWLYVSVMMDLLNTNLTAGS